MGGELTSQTATLLLHMVGEVLGQDLDHGLSGVGVKYLLYLLLSCCLTLEASLCMELFLWWPLGRSPNMSQDSS